jgi:hypothetical protein
MSDKRPSGALQNSARNLVSGLFVAGKQPVKVVSLQMGVLPIEESEETYKSRFSGRLTRKLGHVRFADLSRSYLFVACGARLPHTLKRTYTTRSWRTKLVRARPIAAMLLALLASSSRAQEHQHGNGEKFGTVHFATSCNEVAQKEFNRAVALLHSFQFSRAIEGFNTVLVEDATCGIAYWGIALSDWSNPFAAGVKDKSRCKQGR